MSQRLNQQELFNELAILCSEYETMLNRLDLLSRSFIRGSLQERQRGEQLYYSRNYREDGRHVQLAITPTTNEGACLIRELREKRVALHGRQILRRNIIAIRTALRQLAVYDPEASAGQTLRLDHIALPDRVFLPGQFNAGKWIRDTLAGNYRTNPYYPEDLKYESAAGRWVRSKSETAWDDELAGAGALFRYDSEIQLRSGKVIYADFVVLLPTENRLVIIEHFGKMDDPGYAMKNMRRLQEYAESGYVLGRDLFFTMETKDRPLTHAQIRAAMRQAGILAGCNQRHAGR